MPEPTGSLLSLLELEAIDRDLYRANYVFADPYPLYGGQVAAQALRAAGLTAPEGRLPHSLHGYFLRPGDATRPAVFRVERDRDGRSYSARRVVALQGGEVILNMACSFHVVEDGPDHQVHDAPVVPAAEQLPVLRLPRLFSIESRRPEQPYDHSRWVTRFWARCSEPLGDDALLHACVLTYVSDIGSGLSPLRSGDQGTYSSLDHSMWFHRPVRADEWVLADMVPQTVAGGRGWYTGAMYDAAGRLGASVAQEALFRAVP